MSLFNRTITLLQPAVLAFGAGAAAQSGADAAGRGLRSALLITGPRTNALAEPVVAALRANVGRIEVWPGISAEPTIADFQSALDVAKEMSADAIYGVGGGSAMDVAKLVAALIRSDQQIEEVFGIGKLAGRGAYLACLPTTAGTGSEVSPNAILLDENAQLKKGVISPHLVPDAAYVDPLLTLTVPPAVTAATGVDALTHCIEAYANKLAHPMIDLFAIEGVRLISRSLRRAVQDGSDLAARTDVALGSLYGGLCLGPVNTGAVHALSYPLGGEFHVPHGVANAVLLCPVLEFNLPAAPQRYAEIAVALGAERGTDDLKTARRGLELLKNLCADIGIPSTLRELGVRESDISRMGAAAITITRLLDRNVREVKVADAMEIYRSAF